MRRKYNTFLSSSKTLRERKNGKPFARLWSCKGWPCPQLGRAGQEAAGQEPTGRPCSSLTCFTYPQACPAGQLSCGSQVESCRPSRVHLFSLFGRIFNLFNIFINHLNEWSAPSKVCWEEWLTPQKAVLPFSDTWTGYRVWRRGNW